MVGFHHAEIFGHNSVKQSDVLLRLNDDGERVSIAAMHVIMLVARIAVVRLFHPQAADGTEAAFVGRRYTTNFAWGFRPHFSTPCICWAGISRTGGSPHRERLPRS